MMPSRTDRSVRPELAAEIVDVLQAIGKPAKLRIIDSERGHRDWRELYQMIPMMKEFIVSLPSAEHRTP